MSARHKLVSKRPRPEKHNHQPQAYPADVQHVSEADMVQSLIDADRRRRAARKTTAATSSSRARAARQRRARDPSMFELGILLDVVLDVEPWNKARHCLKICDAWGECARRVPGSVKAGPSSSINSLMQRRVWRLARQLNDPICKSPWKSYPEIKQRVEKIVAKLATEPRLKGKFGLGQQLGAAEPDNSNTALTEKAQATPEILAKGQQQQLGPEKPKRSCTLERALHAYANAAWREGGANVEGAAAPAPAVKPS